MSQLSEIKGGLDCHEHEHAHPKQIQREKKYMAFVIHMLNGNMDKAEKKKEQIEKIFTEQLDNMMYEGDSTITIEKLNGELVSPEGSSESVRIFAQYMKDEYHSLDKAIRLGLRLQWATQFIKK